MCCPRHVPCIGHVYVCVHVCECMVHVLCKNSGLESVNSILAHLTGAQASMNLDKLIFAALVSHCPYQGE